MKMIVSLVLVFLSLNSIAAINLDLNLSQKHLGKTTQKDINVTIDENSEKEIKYGNLVISLTATQDIPEEITNPDIIVGQVLVKMKVYKLENSAKVLVNEAQVLTLVGEKASFESSDLETGDTIKLGVKSFIK